MIEGISPPDGLIGEGAADPAAYSSPRATPLPAAGASPFPPSPCLVSGCVFGTAPRSGSPFRRPPTRNILQALSPQVAAR